jgi:CubicO group peptidase (beta-lactamase class C family)
VWNGKKIISPEWIDKSLTPSPANSHYGYLWWLQDEENSWEGVPNHVYYAAGFGGNFIVVDEENDLVIVLRWIDGSKIGDFVSKVYQAME